MNATEYDSLKQQAKAWNEVFAALTEVNPDWLEGRGSGIEQAVRFIKHLGKTATPLPKEPEILDRDATWKVVGVPIKTVISYLQSLPSDAKIMQDNDDNSHLELIVIR